MIPTNKPFIAVVGPTASGKSEIANALAHQLGAFLLSVDAIQVYKGMDIGTAKVPAEKRSVPYEMIDIVEPLQEYSAALFQRDGRSVIEKHLKEGRAPVLSGGTGFYLDALIDDMFFPAGDPTGARRKNYEQRLENEGSTTLLAQLQGIDPTSAAMLDEQNPRRIIRALEMLDEGTSYAEQNKHLKDHKPFYNARIFELRWPREVLYKRIDSRVDEMFEKGLVHEVTRLKPELLQSKTARQAIGYKEVLDYLAGYADYDKTKALIKQRTRHYAKRQLSWLRRDGRGVPLDMAKLSPEEAVEHILENAT